MHHKHRWSAWTAALVLGSAVALAAEPGVLPRKSPPGMNESYPQVEVLYDSVRDATNHRLRLIVTHPHAPSGPLPTIFVVGWLSCDSVEAPPGTKDPTQLVMQALVALPGFATVRMDKAGVGDSEGDCAATDFLTELAGYQRAFRQIQHYAFVDTDRLFLFGISNGGGFAPLVAEGVPVKGYVVDGGWIKTWYEHMLEIERRRLVLQGHGPEEINTLMQSIERLYARYLLEGEAPRQSLAAHPEWQGLWQGDTDHQYGRPTSYYQQLQQLNLLAAWSAVKVPALVLHGQFDWIMSRADLELMADTINRNTPGAAEFIELPATGHTFEHYPSLEAAFAGKQLPFDPDNAQRIARWFDQHR